MLHAPPDPTGLNIALDLETTGLDWRHDSAFAMALAYPNGLGSYCLDLREPEQFRWAEDNIQKAASLTNHNIKFDLHFLLKHGIKFPKVVHDTMVYAALIYEHHMEYSLDAIAKRYIGRAKDDTVYQKLADLFGGKPTRKEQIGKLHMAPFDSVVTPYAIPDAEIALELFQWQMGELERQELLRVRKLEMDLLPVLLDMEHGGVLVDIDKTEQTIPKVTAEIELAQFKLDQVVGCRLNVNSPKQLQEIFRPERIDKLWWKLCDGTMASSTDSGKAASIDADTLRTMSHPAAPLILEVRNLTKIRDTFLKGHILASAHNGRVHTTFNQTRTGQDDGSNMGTGSGRLSSNAPNLQQVSKRNKKACELVRQLFLPDSGKKWLSIDLSQIDFRIMAHYLQDPSLNAAYFGPVEKVKTGDGKEYAISGPDTDFHQIVAELTGLLRNPTNTSRACAKTVNLGLSFGMGQGRLAEEMGLPFTTEIRPDGSVAKYAGPEALAIFGVYHSKLPGLKGLLAHATRVAKDRGYVKTILGRRCRFPGGQGTHRAGPLIFQGGAADLMKMKLVETHELCKQLDSRLMLTVHDAEDISAPDDPAIGKRVQEAYEANTIGLKIPIRSEWKMGNNWWEAS